MVGLCGWVVRGVAARGGGQEYNRADLLNESRIAEAIRHGQVPRLTGSMKRSTTSLRGAPQLSLSLSTRAG